MSTIWEKIRNKWVGSARRDDWPMPEPEPPAPFDRRVSMVFHQLFIPSVGNDYQPHALSPRRIIFYSVTAVLMKIILFVAVALVPTAAFLFPDVLRDEGRKIITLTNDLRQRQRAPLLSVRPSLENAAFNKAQDMLVQQYFAHIGPDGRDLDDWVKQSGYRYLVVGENLAVGFASANDVVDAWTRSPTHYANLIDPDFKDVGVGMAVGSYDGRETTFVAQYFGASADASDIVLAPITTIPKTVAVPPVPVIARETMSTSSAVLAAPPKINPIVSVTPTIKMPLLARQTPPLKSALKSTTTAKSISVSPPAPIVIIPPPPVVIRPRLALPATTTESGLTQVVIYAPEAITVSLQRADETLGSISARPSSDFFEILLRLSPGEYQLVATAVATSTIVTSTPFMVKVKEQPPRADLARSFVTVIYPSGQNGAVVRATVLASANTSVATVQYGKQKIDLAREAVLPDGFDQWSGYLITSDSELADDLDPVVLPVLTLRDSRGNESIMDLRWENVLPIHPSLVSEYLFAKRATGADVNVLFEFTGWYYRFLLVIAIIALTLNIFIEIRRQYPRLIASAVGLIALLAILIVV